MKYRVCVDDNFHYMDESERYTLGEFATAGEAIAACKRIVDEFLEQGWKPGMSAAELYHGYVGFGEDPFIQTDDPNCKFSAWDYARQRCDELTSGGPARQSAALSAAPTTPAAVRRRATSKPASSELRAELEVVLRAHFEALRKKDPLALLATIHHPEPVAEQLRSQFEGTIASLMEQVPPPDEAIFVMAVTRGDDLAGYYCFRREPPLTRVFLVRFSKVDDRWRLVLPSRSELFAPRAWESVEAGARRFIASTPHLQLGSPEAFPAEETLAPTREESRQALIDCTARNCEVRLTLNGVPVPVGGGSSVPALTGTADPPPSRPSVVLKAGKNEIEIGFQCTDKAAPAAVALCLRDLSGRRLFEFATCGGEHGKFSSSFEAPSPPVAPAA